jgi:hypothetical protein
MIRPPLHLGVTDAEIAGTLDETPYRYGGKAAARNEAAEGEMETSSR